MDRLSVCMLPMLIIACPAALGGCNQPGRSARSAVTGTLLLLEPAVIDLGACRAGETREFTTRLTNRGHRPVTINKYEGSCGCTEIRLSQPTCVPGSPLALQGKVHCAATPGKFRHRISCYEDLLGGEYVTLEVTGEVFTDIHITPVNITLRPRVQVTGATEERLRLHNGGKEVLHLLLPTDLPADVELRASRLEVPPSADLDLVLAIPTDWAVESDFDIVLQTSHPLQSNVPIHVKVRPASSIKLSPRVIRLGVVAKSHLLESRPFVVQLSGSRIEALRIDNVSHPTFLRHIKSQKSDTGTELEFAFVDSFVGIDLKSEIKIDLVPLNEPKTAKAVSVRIPISGILTGE